MPGQSNILIIGKVWPEPTSSAAGSRIMQLIELFQFQDWEITFATAAGESEFAEDLESMGIRTEHIFINDSSFDEFISGLSPDIVFFDRFMTEEQFGWRVSEYCPDALRILDTQDLHSLRNGRHQALKEGRAFTEEDLYSDYAKREIASIYRCDLSLIISEFEMNLLRDVFGVQENLIHYVPFILPKAYDSSWTGFEEREGFISIGNFLHEPNWDAVLYLKNSIWSMIKSKLPNAELYVYGAYASQKVIQLNNPEEGFLVKGRANEVSQVMSETRVCLAPLRFGAGLKGKLIDAMQCGTPSVTTSVGAEGMHGDFSWPGMIEDTPEEFAKAAVRLYSEKPDWGRAQKKCVQIINQRFSRKEIKEGLVLRILEVKDQLKRHRRKNFIGAMLMHHTNASTKYMAKWIEAKNK
ncbi:MAG: glycosyltransferase family 4 protein [Balneolaceae bacterium]|nr:glycosyltransferase family 4 protein [Balneolaceae bacterium]MBO6546420.1 glycosyltransferase family 4 protein [Balneolaceae bacterium]MBO6648779.1 glycosyltransferase family 4 protein [Balneolaceae bacterium]